MRILYYPDPILRQRAEDVEEIDQALVDMARAMFQAMYQARGIGLAAPQVGVGKRLVVLNPTGQEADEVAVVNPVIVESEGTQEAEEGCLSVPGLYTRIRRAARVLVRAYDLEGNERTFEAGGLTARLWQHEIDHLEGVLIVDRMSPLRRLAAARLLRDLERQFRRASK